MQELTLKQTLNSLSGFIPETVLIATVIVCLFLDLILRKKSVIVAVAGIVGLLVSGYFAYLQFGMREVIFTGMAVVDPFAVFFKILFVVSTIFVIIFTISSKEIQESTHHNEHVYLMVAMALGAFLMASASNMIMMYLSLETVSISSYILSGYTKRIKRSSEAAMKYVIYGAASSGIMIYGMSLIYGFTGSMNIYEISAILAKSAVTGNPVIVMSIIMILAGFGYKISSVPFHFWTPDVYEGAPVPVTAFLAVTSSAAGFAVMIRFFAVTFLQNNILLNGKLQIIPGINWTEIIVVLSVASMIIGNFTAVWQQSVKRMLAYSSIAQGGYIMLGMTMATQQGLTAMLVYLMGYLFMTLGAFYVVILVANKVDSDELVDMRGFGYKSPVIAVFMAVFMFSLAGIPSTVGFVGKFYLFSALIESNMVWLALVAVLNSVVSLFFYIKVLKYMFLMKPEEELTPKYQYGIGNYAVLLLLALPVMFFGLYFAPLVKIAEYSAILIGLK
ncbi:MAG: NADH-quinone oxidoreductase subunit N [Ignavibacteriota bacterium]|nr:NADH-quinone oxidoreductase subunit N [Ignavibacteriota bacterium]